MNYAEIILEILDRVKKLEKEVEVLKKNQIGQSADKVENNANLRAGEQFFQSSAAETAAPLVSAKRDTTRYMFDGNVYLKNRLVLAVVHKYVNQSPEITRQKLKQDFDKSLQGSIGVVENSEIAEKRHDYTVRFFTKTEEVLHLADGDMYVCSQWGILNIPNFLKRAEQMGFQIEPINIK